MAGVADYTDQNYLPALQAGNLLAATNWTHPLKILSLADSGRSHHSQSKSRMSRALAHGRMASGRSSSAVT